MEKTKQMYLTARESAGILNMSVSYSYTIVAQLNMELEKMGKYVIHGKVPTQFFLEKFYERIETTLNTYSHLYPNKQAQLANRLDGEFERKQKS